MVAAVLAGPRPPLLGLGSLGDRWIRWVLHRHRVILLAAGVLTIVAGLFAMRLQINSDLRVLLPTDHKVVRSLERIESAFGSTNSVNFVAKGGTVEARHAFTDALEARLASHALFRDVEHGLPSEFFAERALFYLSDAEMDELAERIDAWTHYQLCTNEPSACLTKPEADAPTRLRTFIEDKRERSYEQIGFRGRYEREGIDAEVLLAHPHEPAAKLDVSREVTEVGRSIAAEVFAQSGAPWADSGMTYNVVGPYVTKADAQKTVLRDMLRSGIFAFLGVVLILYFLFRSHRAVLVLLVPLICGVVWSLAATQMVLGHLNPMTSTISTVVMGVGIDAGIHFFSRARRSRATLDDGEAICRAFDGLVLPLLIASSTTIGAFASMASSDFPAFHEFGVIAALGVALCLLSMVTVLPALCYLVGIKKRASTRTLDDYSPVTRLVLARPGLLFSGLVLVTGLSLFGARKVDFEYNGRKIQSDEGRRNSEPDAKLISQVFGKDIHASVLVRPTLEESRATLVQARARHQARVAQGNSVVADLFGVTDLLPDPALDQRDRARRITALKSEHEGLLDQLRERTGLPPRGRPDTPTPEEDGGDWDDWDDEGETPSGDEDGTAAKPVPTDRVEPDDDWDAWDGSEDDEDEPGAEADAPSKAAGTEPVDAAVPPKSKDTEPTAAAETPTPAAKGTEGADETETPTPAAKGTEGADETDAPTPAAKGTEGADETEATTAKTSTEGAKAGEAKGTDDAAAEDELSKEDAELMLAMLEAKPFTVDDLPQVLLNKVRASDGSYGLFAYPDFDVADMKKGLVFMEETSSYLDPSEDAIFVGEAVVYAAMYLMLREEAPVVLGMASILIALLVFWQLRSLSLMLMTLIPLGLGLLWLLGVMGTIDMRFTLFNLPILPAILGIGVDNGVYLTDRIRGAPATFDGLASALQETGGAILAATATTAVGFAAFMIADSGGVRGIGSVAVLGIVLAALAALLVLPTLTALLQRRRR